MIVKKVVTYQQVEITDEENDSWMQRCSLNGDQVTEIEGWKTCHNNLVIISLGNNKWLVPVLDHTGEERYD